LDRINRKAIDLLVEVRAERAKANRPYPISGCLGPRDDGYAPGMLMTAEASHAYHRPQIATFADTQADLITAMTLAYPRHLDVPCGANDADGLVGRS
jgi:S-methylmethionine-dependent homocysteine/selenocysteine methylase